MRSNSSQNICDCQNVDCNTLPEVEVKKSYSCLVVLCCALSRVLLWLYEAWITDRSDYFQLLKMLVLYRSSGKIQNKMLFSPDTLD